MKHFLTSALGVVGGAIAAAFGGWGAGMTTLCIFMAVDYVTGLLVAGVFHASKKSESGRLDSRAGFKGLLRKGMILLMDSNGVVYENKHLTTAYQPEE